MAEDGKVFPTEFLSRTIGTSVGNPIEPEITEKSCAGVI
jgi:hypothetical protein